MKKFTTQNASQTKALGKLLAEEVRGGEIICLSGDLGAGKTTFTQGFLEGIGVEGPYTSPTFAIMKKYELQETESSIRDIYHIDAYRVVEKDVADLGWHDFAGKENCVTIVEWSERISGIVPADSLHIHLKWTGDEKREIILK